MLINQKIGNLETIAVNNRAVDTIALEWYETTKRILHKKTAFGKEVTMKFLNESSRLLQDDVLYEDALTLITIDIQPCESIIIKPETMADMAYVCYEIGNKHLPLFYQEEELLIPYEAPLMRMLHASGFNVRIESRKLLKQLSTSVSPHLHNGSSASLFSRILQLTTKPADGKPSS
jgi:urease accessory protein